VLVCLFSTAEIRMRSWATMSMDCLTEMVVDSSAIIAILLKEKDGPRFETSIVDAECVRVRAVTFLETAIVLRGIQLR
jgi:hypothetical protein